VVGVAGQDRVEDKARVAPIQVGQHGVRAKPRILCPE